MFQKNGTIFKSKISIIIFLALIFSSGFFSGSARANLAEHLIISEIQVSGIIADDEFIEIYNPTNLEVSLENWDIKRKTSTGSESNVLNNIQGVIKPYGYFLITPRANCGEDKTEICYKGNVISDDEYTTNSFLADDNSILLYNNAGEIVDEAMWTELPKGQALERKAWQGGACVSAQGGGELLGNGCDSGSIDDFEFRNIPNPQNSLSAPEFPEEESQPITLTPTLAPNPSLEPAISPTASVSPVQSILPVAEAGGDKEAVIGENIDFDGSDSFDPQGKELVLSWDFGDKISAKGENVSHSYSAIGEYNVILKAVNGENISEDSLKVKIVAPEFSDKIILSEILPNPTGADKDGEWIKLFNSSDKKVNLKGWILASGAKTGGKQYIFSGDNFIEAKSYLVIKRSVSGLVLTNENGNVSLAWPPDKILSEVSYGAAKEGKIYAFLNNTWQWVDAPTPGKENSGKVSIAANSQAAEKASGFADILENPNTKEVSGGKDASVSGNAAKASLAKSTVSQPAIIANIEDYFNKLISEKVAEAIFMAKADEAVPQEKVQLAANVGMNEITDINKESVCRDFCSESGKNVPDNGRDVRNNPWFYGDIALSILSLFLVWRYQEVRKRLK